jgi:hypothetical protein
MPPACAGRSADDSGNHDDGTEKDESAARAQRRTRLLRSSRARADRDTRMQLRVGLHGPRRSGDGGNRRPDERAEGGLTRALWNVQLMSGKFFGAPAPATRYAALARPRHAACLTPSTMMARLSDYWDSRPRPANTDAWNSNTAAPIRPSSARSLSPGQIIETGTISYRLAHARRQRQTPTTSARSPSSEIACAADTGPPA